MKKLSLLLLLCLIVVLCYFLSVGISKDFDVRYKKYFGFLIESLNSQEVTVKLETIRIFSDIGDKSVIERLKKILSDKSDPVKIESARALYILGDKSGREVLVKILKTKLTVSVNDKPAKRARALARNLLRARAAEVLGEVADKSAMGTLREMAKDKDGRVKDSSLIALIKLGDRSGVDIFISGLESSEVSVRKRCCEVMGEIKEEKVKYKLKELLKNWNKEVRQSASIALGKIGDKKYIPDVRELLDDKEEIVRIAAAEALGLFGDEKFIPQLREKLKDNNGFVRLAAAESLLKLGDNSGEGFVFNSLKSPETDARLKSVEILQAFGKESAIGLLESGFNEEKIELVKLNIAGAIIRIISREKEKNR